ncbi:hypothetical protein [Dyadobacter sp. 676]|uniref:Uncharacterized protein n=1 Tax=Dyadobacter sp. 676 TaxID=3088362 RepID=A0AAU8FV37_9BACT
MVHFRETFTFFRTRVAYLRARLAQGGCMRAAHAHKPHGCGTYYRAFAIEGDTERHQLNVVLFQAFRRAMFAFGSAQETRFYAAAISLSDHRKQV